MALHTLLEPLEINHMTPEEPHHVPADDHRL